MGDRAASATLLTHTILFSYVFNKEAVSAAAVLLR